MAVLSLFGALLAPQHSAAQLTLPAGTSYTQDFNGLGSGLPTGWTVRTGATSTARGTTTTIVATPNSGTGATSTSWAETSAAFRNMASANSLTSAATAAAQASATDRALGVRQTGSFADPGASFELELANTSARTGFSLSVKHQMLNVQARSTTWSVQYSTNSGAAWTTIGTYTDPGSFGSTNGSYSLGTALDNVNSTVLLRVVALTAASGTGSRDSYGIDDFSLTWTNAAGNDSPVASSVNFSGSLVTGSTLTGSYTYSDTESDPEGTSTYRWFRANDAAGTGAVATGGTSITYQPGSSDVGKYLTFRVTPVASSGSLTGTEVASAYQGPIVSATNSVSTITVDGTFTPTANVDYTTSVGTDVTASSFEMARFSLNDVTGSPFDDGLATTLTALSFSVTSSSNLEKIALYDGSTELAEVTAAATTSFSGLTLSAASGTSKIFSVRVTFKTTVTDNAQPQLTISSATADPAGSLFAAANAGGASSSITGDNNRIEVTATKLAFTTTPSQTIVNVAMASQSVEAVDVNNRRDLDFVSAIDITSSGTLSTSPVTATATSGLASYTTITHTVVGTGLTLTASSGALAPGVSAAFNIVPAPIFANPITGTNPGQTNPYTAGQSFDANITVSGIGRGAGIAGNAANNRYNTSSWDTTSLDTTGYIEFVLTPVAGYQIDFTNFIYTGQASGSGPTNVVFRSSVDSFASNVGTALINGTTISLTDAAFQNVSAPITFRLYAWGASASGGTFSVDSFEFNGVVELSPTPQVSAAPSTITGLNYFENAGPSASQTISVTGANLTPASGNLTASATSGFEVSTDNTNFSSSVNVAYTGGALTNVPVYVRQTAGTAAGDYSGTVTISGGGAPVDATVSVSGKVVIPFDIPFFNSFATQANVDDAIAKGFVANNAAFNTSYLRLNAIGAYLDTPVIDFTQESNFRVSFEAATFGGNTGQTLELQISTDGGANFTPLASVAPTSGTVYSTLTYDIDVASYPSTNGKLRITMTAGTNQTRLRNLYLLGRTTWDGAAWSNGAPNSLVAATITGDYTTSSDPSITAYSLDVANGGSLTVTSGYSVTLQNALTVGNTATAEFANNANLIQVNSVANTGNISISRTANMRRQDYIYWSSPVAAQNLFNFSDQTLSNRFYVLDEDTNSFQALFTATPTGLGQSTTTYNFIPTKGYMVRAPNNHPSTVTAWTGTFTGVPNNGTYTFQATNGVATTAVGNNLIGNPYPSPINANSFLAANPTVGTLYFWAHITQTAPGGANYASYNGTGAAAAAGGDTPNGFIQVGQGFLVTVPASVTINFNNTMRANNFQNQFFRSSGNSLGTDTPERHRIWLDLKKDGAVMSQSLVGYVSEATNDIEPLYDGAMIPENAPQLYSVLGGQAYSIQGRALPFADSDIVPMGIKTPTAGTYTITLNNVDGLFGEQAIYLKDNVTNVIHDIKSGDYSFATEAGTFNDRFEIVYNTTTLGTDHPELTDNKVVVYENGASLEVNSGNVPMQSVKIFDIRGRLLASREGINANSTSFATLSTTQQVLLVQVVGADGTTVTKKVIF